MGQRAPPLQPTFQCRAQTVQGCPSSVETKRTPQRRTDIIAGTGSAVMGADAQNDATRPVDLDRPQPRVCQQGVANLGGLVGTVTRMSFHIP